MSTPGIHHVTAIAGEPQKNLDFYTGVLGLKLAKLTVNFDDPGTYHFYFGDGDGTPGTILTFFPWAGAPRGRKGTAQTTAVAFAIPTMALETWMHRLSAREIRFRGPDQRFGEQVLSFSDPDDLHLELIATESAGRDGREITGFHSVTLSESGYEATASLLTDQFGYTLTEQSENRFRYASGEGGRGAIVDLLCQPDLRTGSMGVGTVHHVAFRAETDQRQLEMREKLSGKGFNVTPVLDRQYFHSIYFREPGGVLFEIATDPPGFGIDEPVGQLGRHLKLPDWMEPNRREIEAMLPSLRLP